jgi:hypothetical protein
MCRENSCDIDATLFAERKSDTGKPLVEMSNNGSLLFMSNELLNVSIECEKKTGSYSSPLPRTRQLDIRRQWLRWSRYHRPVMG